MTCHLVIPDTQCKPGVPTDHLSWIGKYIVEQKPDTIVHLGDHWDMHSLSSYDRGKKAGEGSRYQEDIDSGNKAFKRLNDQIDIYNATRRRFKEKLYKPRRVLLRGNHEYRLQRYVNDYPVLEGKLSDSDFIADGWEVIPFLHIEKIDGIAYSHYFYNCMTGRPWGGMMETRLKNVGFTFTQGHQQGKKTGERELADGSLHRGLVVGSCYLHDEDYIGVQGNHHWRGIIVKHEVENGDYDLMEVSLNFLCRKYEQMSVADFLMEKYGMEWSHR